MIQNFDLEQLTGADQIPGHFDVGLTRRAVEHSGDCAQRSTTAAPATAITGRNTSRGCTLTESGEPRLTKLWPMMRRPVLSTRTTSASLHGSYQSAWGMLARQYSSGLFRGDLDRMPGREPRSRTRSGLEFMRRIF